MTREMVDTSSLGSAELREETIVARGKHIESKRCLHGVGNSRGEKERTSGSSYEHRGQLILLSENVCMFESKLTLVRQVALPEPSPDCLVSECCLVVIRYG